MKATFVRDIETMAGDARLYRFEDGTFVVVSAVNAPVTGPETYIFDSDELGVVSNWNELGGSFRGALDHERALRNAGHDPATELKEECAVHRRARCECARVEREAVWVAARLSWEDFDGDRQLLPTTMRRFRSKALSLERAAETYWQEKGQKGARDGRK